MGGIMTGWYDEEHNILLTEFFGFWTWDQWWETYRVGRKLTESINYKVASIVDLTHSNPFPLPGSLYQLKRVYDLNRIDPHIGITVYVNASRLMKIIIRVLWIYFQESAG